ncbi:hypothetical protein KM043_015329 [Ampulex compressa]|nr:hypothetical protein KM043_015329 [Ampulex compressa]
MNADSWLEEVAFWEPVGFRTRNGWLSKYPKWAALLLRLVTVFQSCMLIGTSRIKASSTARLRRCGGVTPAGVECPRRNLPGEETVITRRRSCRAGSRPPSTRKRSAKLPWRRNCNHPGAWALSLVTYCYERPDVRAPASDLAYSPSLSHRRPTRAVRERCGEAEEEGEGGRRRRKGEVNGAEEEVPGRRRGPTSASRARRDPRLGRRITEHSVGTNRSQAARYSPGWTRLEEFGPGTILHGATSLVLALSGRSEEDGLLTGPSFECRCIW